MNLERMVGQRILAVSWSARELLITTDLGTWTGTAEGDCCSSSWFESVDVDYSGERPQRVAYVEEDDRAPPGYTEPDEAELAKYDVLQTYFGCIRTDCGRITWELRNDSNGFYGGHVNWKFIPAEVAVE